MTHLTSQTTSLQHHCCENFTPQRSPPDYLIWRILTYLLIRMPKPILEFKEQYKVDTNLIVYYMKKSQINLVFCHHGIALIRVPKRALRGIWKEKHWASNFDGFLVWFTQHKKTWNFEIRMSAVCMEHIYWNHYRENEQSIGKVDVHNAVQEIRLEGWHPQTTGR